MPEGAVKVMEHETETTVFDTGTEGFDIILALVATTKVHVDCHVIDELVYIDVVENFFINLG